MIYAATCHALKTDQKTDIKIDDYFKWKERSLFDILVAFKGANRTNVRFGPEESDKVVTTITYEYKSSDVINNNRENKFPRFKPNGTYEIETLKSFNPPGKYGKIQDSDLIRIKHNPCFECSFTAWVNLRRRTENAVFTAIDNDEPPTGDESYEQFEVVRGPEIIGYDPGDLEPIIGFLVNSVQRVVASYTIKIHSGFIDPITKNLGKVLTFSGFTESDTSPNATFKVGSAAYNGTLAGLESGISVQIEWLPNKQRPA